MKKQKYLHLRPKMPYLGIYDQKCLFSDKKCLFFGVFVQEFKKKKNYCHIWNHHTWICVIAKYRERMKCLNFVQKGPYLGIFQLEFYKTWKQYCRIWNQHPRICVIAKFWRKIKMSEFWTKNALFWYFWRKMR